VIGILAAQVVNYLIAKRSRDATDDFILNSWNGQMGWRWMFWAGTVPAIIFLFYLFHPESPRFLANQKQ
jgi:MFS family permease